jgi:hypothetical protein
MRGLARVSITQDIFFEGMDCRVKPGNDDRQA